MSHNLYCYCLNIPVVGKDTNGFSFQDDLGDFVADAAAFASAIWDGMEQRADAFIENPNIDTFLNWMTMGLTQYNYENALTMIEDPTFYNITNYITMGIPDTISGALDPEEPLSFDHWLCSAALVSRARMASPYMRAAVPYVKSTARSGALWFMGLNKGEALCIGNLKMYYATPNSGGGVLINYKGPRMQFRIDCDNSHFLHMHYGTGKTLKVHRQITLYELKNLIQYIKNLE